MVDKNDVAAVLELIRPSLQVDGGDVRMSQMTLANGVERILKERVPGVTKVVPDL